MSNVFVYGTLKQGYHNNELLKAHRFVGEAVIHGYKAYNCGYPIARFSDQNSLIGEVWDIGDDRTTLARLDRLESEGYSYSRKSAKAILLEDKKDIDVELYVGIEDAWFSDGKVEFLVECPKDEHGNYFWTGRER